MQDIFQGSPWNNAGELWRQAWRARWWFLAPFFLLGLLGFVVQWAWPPRYRSEALIEVREQVVAPKLVAPNVQITAADRLQSMTQQILSRTRLQNLIQTEHLYPGARQRLDMEALVARMRKDIEIQPVVAPDQPGGLASFRISYLASSPRLAQRVVNELAALFIEDNLQARAAESAGTTDFLQTQLEQARQQMNQQEAALQAYKVRYLGQLPEQQQSNLAILSSLRAQYSAGADELDRDAQEQAYWQSLAAAYSHGQSAVAAPTSPQAHVRALQEKLAELSGDHTALYPDVVTTKRELAKWQALAAREGKATDGGAGTLEEPAQAEAASRLDGLQLAIKKRRQSQAALAARIRRLSADLGEAPVRAQQIAALERGVNNAQQAYDALLNKVGQSQLATDLEQSQQGERFQVIDPASLPRRPAVPNRALILLAGWLLGLVAGAGALVIRQTCDHTVRGEDALAAVASLPVLATIGSMTSPRRRRLAAWWRTAELAAMAGLVVLAAGSVAFTVIFMS